MPSKPITDLRKPKSSPAERELASLKEEVKGLRARAKRQISDEALFMSLKLELEQYADQMALKPHGKRPRKRRKSSGRIIEDCVLHLSDEHADQIVLPHRVNNLEEYNFPIAMARAENLVETVRKFTQETMENYAFNTLWILANGDHVNGEIHGGTGHSAFKNPFRNALATGQMHALMIRDFAQWFPDIKVLYTAGNHGRMTKRKDYEGGAWNNWDYLVAEAAKLHCRDLPHVEFLIPDAWSVNVDIGGWVFNVQHGDDVKSWNSIPFYGLERQSRRLQSLAAVESKAIHYFVRGHFHTSSTMANPTGELLLNGSWKATDPYSLNALGGYGKPSQLLHGVHADHGVTWRLPVYLASERDAQGPQRYQINLAHVE